MDCSVFYLTWRARKKTVVQSIANHWCGNGYYKLSFSSHDSSAIVIFWKKKNKQKKMKKKKSRKKRIQRIIEMQAIAKLTKLSPFECEYTYFDCIHFCRLRIEHRLKKHNHWKSRKDMNKKKAFLQRFGTKMCSLRWLLSVFIVWAFGWKPDLFMFLSKT